MSTQVTLQHVDLENSYLSGYLQINGLTDDFPVLITFFDGEIISEKHPFLTRYELTVIKIKNSSSFAGFFSDQKNILSSLATQNL